MTNRGFFGIGLQNCKTPANLGSVLRLASNYGAALVAVEGKRIRPGSTDTFKTARHRPLLYTDNLFSVLPHGCVPIAVELSDNAVSLFEFQHPESAFYILGPEDGNVKNETLKRCVATVMIPTNYCLNLAMVVATVLYDRAFKCGRRCR